MSTSLFGCKKLKTLLLHRLPLYLIAFARESNRKLNDKINKIMEEPSAGLCVDAARVADQPQSMTRSYNKISEAYLTDESAETQDCTGGIAFNCRCNKHNKIIIFFVFKS